MQNVLTIGILVFAVVVLIVIVVRLLVKINRIDGKKRPSSVGKSENREAYVRVDPSRANERQQVKKDPQNPHYKLKIGQVMEKNIDLIVRCTSYALHPYFYAHEDLVDILEKRQEKWDSSFIQILINHFKLSKIKADIEEVYSGFGEVLSIYNEIVKDMKKGFNYKVIDVFIIEEDKLAVEARSLANTLKQEQNIFYIELNELQTLQSRLKNDFERVDKLLNKSGWDWGEFCKGAVGGGLSVVNPFIGIPLVVGNFIGIFKRDKEEQAFITSYMARLDEFFNKSDEVREADFKVYEKHTIMLKNRLMKTWSKNIENLLSKLDEQGVSLREVVTYFEKSLRELEEEIEYASKEA
jgi:hypothetical protein